MKFCREVFLILALLLPLSVYAENSNLEYKLSSSLNWMANHQLENGLFKSSNMSSLSWQATHEALESILTTPLENEISVEHLPNWIDANEISYMEYLSRSANILRLLELDDSNLLSKIIPVQNNNGGFGSSSGFDSNPYDSAFALLALKHSMEENRYTIQSTLQFLKSQQSPNGSFQIEDNLDSPVVTAHVLSALRPFLFQFDIGTMISDAQNYLLTLLSDSNELDKLDDWKLALVLESVIPVSTDIRRYQAAVDRLLSAQHPDGSWQQDIYSTAMGIKVLKLMRQIDDITDPLHSIIKGKVTLKNSLLPLGNTKVTLENTDIESVSAEDGSFELLNIGAGSYVIRYELQGYYTGTQSIEVTESRIIDLGDVSLTPLPQYGTVQGIITSLEDGLPLEGVRIKVVGSENSETFSLDDGSFLLTTLPGSVTISASKSGYIEASGSANIKSGEHLYFSPSLLIEDATGPDPVVNITGKIVDSTTGSPIVDAQINVGDDAFTYQADQSGNFIIENMPLGTLRISVSATGYNTVAMDVLSVQGGVIDLGSIMMSATAHINNSMISGSVVDAVDGLNVPYAQLTITSQDQSLNSSPPVITAESDIYGNFEVNNVNFLSMDIKVRANGFFEANKSLTLSDHGRINLGVVTLQPNKPELISSITGTITEIGKENGIPFADIQLIERDIQTGTQPKEISVQADSQGKYWIDDIDFLSMDLFVQSKGYRSSFQNFQLTKHGLLTMDVELSPFKAASVKIPSLTFDREKYAANNQVSIVTSLINEADAARTVRILLEVENSAGDSIQSMYLGDDIDKAGTPQPVSLLPDVPVTINGQWFTGIHQPGHYRLVLNAFDTLSGQVVAQKSEFIQIEETADLTDLTLLISPKISRKGDEASISIDGVAKYIGNVSSVYSLNYEFIDPNDLKIKEDIVEISLSPLDTSKVIHIFEDTHTFLYSGRYMLKAEVIEDSLMIKPEWITVAPEKSIDISHQIVPEIVLPGDDQRLNVEIKLQGMEQL